MLIGRVEDHEKRLSRLSHWVAGASVLVTVFGAIGLVILNKVADLLIVAAKSAWHLQ